MSADQKIDEMFKLDNVTPEIRVFENDQDDEAVLLLYEAGMLPRYSHDGLAFFLGYYGWNHDAKYVREQSRWFFFDGVKWSVDKKMAAYSQVRKYLRATVSQMMAEAV